MYDLDAAEKVNLEFFDQDPNDPFPLISAAAFKSMFQHQHEAAMSMIDRAIPVAYRTGLFAVHTLATKARIALELKQYDVVADVIRKIMDLDGEFLISDVRPERDFFDRLPPGAIDPELARRYDQYTADRRRHGDDGAT
jgi:hypothetical protein